ATVKDTLAAVGPIDVPRISLVTGMRTTNKIIKGMERIILTIVPATCWTNLFSKNIPSLVTKSMTPRGTPIIMAKITAMDIIQEVSINAFPNSLSKSGDIGQHLQLFSTFGYKANGSINI